MAEGKTHERIKSGKTQQSGLFAVAINFFALDIKYKETEHGMLNRME